MMKKIIITAAVASLLTACQSTAPNQTNKTNIQNKQSSALVARSAYDFEDSDITVPAYFDTQGLSKCTFDRSNENSACPLKKPIVRVYFGDNQVVKGGIGAKELGNYDNQKLVQMLENQLAGLNRFRIVTRDDAVVGEEQATYLAEQGAANFAKRASANKILAPDYIIKIDTLKSVDVFHAEGYGVMDYNMELTSSVMDPFTKEKLSHPNIGKIRVKSKDVTHNKDDMHTIIVSGRNYQNKGFNFEDPQTVNKHLSSLASRGFDIFLTRLLSEMPATAQVLGIKGEQISLDRGQNAGILKDETMIIFQYEAGFVDPVGVATVNPSRQSANGMIVRWKNSKLADTISTQSESGIYRPSNGSKLFAISVGTPSSFIEERL
jgi:hypothetical protein